MTETQQLPTTATLVLQRKRGTVTVTSSADGWVIVGEGKTTCRMRIPRCTCNKHVCPTLHRGWGGTRTLYHDGPNDGHGRNHCHGGHVERVRSLIDIMAKTYGPKR